MDLILLFFLASAIWVGFDATGRDFSRSRIAHSPIGWFFGTLLLWIIIFPAYLGTRGRYPRLPAGSGRPT